MNAMETRKAATALGIKNAAKFTKAQLEDMILAAEQKLALAGELPRNADAEAAVKAELESWLADEPADDDEKLPAKAPAKAGTAPAKISKANAARETRQLARTRLLEERAAKAGAADDTPSEARERRGRLAKRAEEEAAIFEETPKVKLTPEQRAANEAAKAATRTVQPAAPAKAEKAPKAKAEKPAPAPKAEKPKAVKIAKQLCRSCERRPITAENKRNGLDMCGACEEESGWENEHSDHSHDEIAAGTLTMKNTTFTSKKELKAYLAHESERMANCWICHPELNRALATYVPRQGTSRVGMTMSVPVRGSGEEKAAAVVAKLPSGLKPAVTKFQGGRVQLTIQTATGTMTLLWDAAGRYDYNFSSYVNGEKSHKIRNISAALKIMGAK